MARSAARTLTVVVICLIAVATALALGLSHRRRAAESAKTADPAETGQGEDFISKFDSLAGVHLYPTLYQWNTFARSAFDEEREEWILTVRAAEWDRLSRTFRKDLVTLLFGGFQGVREQAGADPKKSRLVINYENGEEVLVCAIPESGPPHPPLDTLTLAKFTLAAASIGVVILTLVLCRGKRKEILLSALSVVFVVFTVEIGLKHFHPQVDERGEMFEYDGELGWRFVPNLCNLIKCPDGGSHHIHINSWRFRDDPPTVNHDHMRKIMVLGDSFVSNVSVEDDEVFTEVIESQLEDTVVLNLGVNGYGQVQEYLLLQRWLDTIEPDIVMLLVYIRNDFNDNLGSHWRHPRPVARWNADYSTLRLEPPLPDMASDPSFYGRLWALGSRSHLFCLVNSRIDILIDRLRQRGKSEHEASLYTPPELYLCKAELSSSTALMYKTMETLLLRIAQCVHDQGVPVVFVVAPSFLQADEALWSSALAEYDVDPAAYECSLPNKRLMEFAADNELLMLDLLPILQAELREGKEVFNPEEQHWTGQGNQIVASAIVDYLVDNSLAEPLAD